MRKKAKKTSKSAETTDLSLMEKLKAFFLTIQLYIKQMPGVLDSIIPNPFTDHPTENGPTNTKRPELESYLQVITYNS